MYVEYVIVGIPTLDYPALFRCVALYKAARIQTFSYKSTRRVGGQAQQDE